MAERLTGTPPVTVIELAELGAGAARLGRPRRRRRQADGAGRRPGRVRIPTYKATYTGLLKLFLDQFSAGELHGTTAVALMLGGSASTTPWRGS